MKSLLLTLITLLPAAAFELPASSSQCLVGTAEGWDSSHVTLRLYQKSGGSWKPASAPWQGRLGKNGLIWGKGHHPVPAGVGTKKEGDSRSPAGVFSIGGAWGYSPAIAKNAPPNVTPHAGSSIFFHIWRREGAAPTAGCTTMEKPKLEWLISQIDPAKRPLYVLLPQAEYQKFRAAWKLP
jgi:L,D-peptidoglycan transpeptidase YkuD (ErfK/YbiS/YcfS/YnhG family)